MAKEKADADALEGVEETKAPKAKKEVTQEEMLTPSGQDEAQEEPKRIGFRYMPHYGKYVYSLAHTNF